MTDSYFNDISPIMQSPVEFYFSLNNDDLKFAEFILKPKNITQTLLLT